MNENSDQWMYDVFSEKDLEQIQKKSRELSPSGNGILEYKYAIDKVLKETRTEDLVPPFNPPRGSITDHFVSINENLYLAYPYYFTGKQMTDLVKSASEKGFNVIVDPIASRYKAGNLRIIIWRQGKNSISAKNAKK